MLFLPNANTASYNSGDGTVNGKKLLDFFKDATGLEILSLEVGTGKDAVFAGIYTLNGTAGGG